MESKISEANSHEVILIPAGDFSTMAISCVYNLIFSCRMESKISEANNHPSDGFISVCDDSIMAISYQLQLLYIPLVCNSLPRFFGEGLMVLSL